MITQTQLDQLRVKILPPGTERVLELLALHRDHVETIGVIIDKVPLLIIGRHGMITRLPMNGVLQKVSQTKEVLSLLEQFFTSDNTLYLFVNLPDLQIPPYISQLLGQIAEKYEQIVILQSLIDEALDRGDRTAFLHYTTQLKDLDTEQLDSSP